MYVMQIGIFWPEWTKKAARFVCVREWVFEICHYNDQNEK